MSLNVYLRCSCCNSELFEKNITHNLNIMAKEVGIYDALWRPEEINAKIAQDIQDILYKGLKELKLNPEKYKKFNPENGWGDYEGLVEFVEKYLYACLKFPYAIIEVSR